jgi:hypothetical protein
VAVGVTAAFGARLRAALADLPNVGAVPRYHTLDERLLSEPAKSLAVTLAPGRGAAVASRQDTAGPCRAG